MPPLAGRGVVGELGIEVDVDGARDVPGAERGAPVGLGQGPAHVEHDGARGGATVVFLVEAAGELVGGDEDRHAPILPDRPPVEASGITRDIRASHAGTGLDEAPRCASCGLDSAVGIRRPDRPHRAR
jgi:hypothetical protein